jgi:hypothetical protein
VCITVCFLTIGFFDGIQDGLSIVQKFAFFLEVKWDYYANHLALLILIYSEFVWLGFLGNVK